MNGVQEKMQKESEEKREGRSEVSSLFKKIF